MAAQIMHNDIHAIGQIVWFYDKSFAASDLPRAAMITGIHPDHGKYNVTVFTDPAIDVRDGRKFAAMARIGVVLLDALPEDWRTLRFDVITLRHEHSAQPESAQPDAAKGADTKNAQTATPDDGQVQADQSGGGEPTEPVIDDTDSQTKAQAATALNSLVRAPAWNRGWDAARDGTNCRYAIDDEDGTLVVFNGHNVPVAQIGCDPEEGYWMQTVRSTRWSNKMKHVTDAKGVNHMIRHVMAVLHGALKATSRKEASRPVQDAENALTARE